MLSFIDFIFGLLHFIFYYTAYLGKYSIYVPYKYHTYMQSVFYILWFVLLLVILLSLKDRGCTYMFYMFLLVLALIFIIILLFANKAWQRKTVGYIIFIANIFYMV